MDVHDWGGGGGWRRPPGSVRGSPPPGRQLRFRPRRRRTAVGGVVLGRCLLAGAAFGVVAVLAPDDAPVAAGRVGTVPAAFVDASGTGRSAVTVTGVVDRGDAARFSAAAEAVGLGAGDVVALDVAGGDTGEARRIAAELRRRGASTLVGLVGGAGSFAPGFCGGACLTVLRAGAERMTVEGSRLALDPGVAAAAGRGASIGDAEAAASGLVTTTVPASSETAGPGQGG